MGDVQRFGAPKLSLASAAVGSSWAVSGGKAQLLEAQLLNLASGGALNSESAAIVVANLQRSGSQEGGSSYSGMGDLHMVRIFSGRTRTADKPTDVKKALNPYSELT